jgi:serine/threonine protein kinase
VWLARDTRERGLVWAVKELDFEAFAPGERAEARDLFEREADLLMRLHHPCLPAVVDRFSEGGREYLVMERVEGPTLDQILEARGTPLEERDVARWSAQICAALEYLHGQVPPVVYRDVKPSNIMVRVDGVVKLIDFGIARSMNPARRGDTMAYGTPGYAPPEQYAGKAEPRSDLYGLGVTMFQLLTRCDPQEKGFQCRGARRFNSALSAEMAALLDACTEPAAAARPSSARDLREALEHLAERPNRAWWRRVLGR